MGLHKIEFLYYTYQSDSSRAHDVRLIHAHAELLTRIVHDLTAAWALGMQVCHDAACQRSELKKLRLQSDCGQHDFSALMCLQAGWGDDELDKGATNPHFEPELYAQYSSSTQKNLARLDENRIDFDVLEDLILHIDAEFDDGAILVFLPGVTVCSRPTHASSSTMRGCNHLCLKRYALKSIISQCKMAVGCQILCAWSLISDACIHSMHWQFNHNSHV